MTMTILSQNDPRWKNIKLGTSTQTIGGFGCTITSIAMIVGTTPDVVNEKLKAVGGYVNGNLVVWAKIEEAFPGIKVRRVWTYDNADVKNNLPCIVEVDGKPIGGFRHFVVYVGNQQLYDPWDGHVDPTTDYPNPLSYAVISGKWEGQTESDTDTQKVIDELRLARDNNWNLYQAQIQETQKKQERIEEIEKENSELKNSKTNLTKDINTCEIQVGKLLDDIQKLNEEDKNTSSELLSCQHSVQPLKDEAQAVRAVLNVMPETDTQTLVKTIEILKSSKVKIQKVTDMPFFQKLKILFG